MTVNIINGTQKDKIQHFSTSDGGCFPSTSRVNLVNGKSVTMSELKIGDKVQTGRDSYLEYLFCHLYLD